MNEQERQELLAALEKQKRTVAKNKRAARKFLRDVGIYTKSNKLSKNYSNLCIPQSQG